MQGLGPKPPFQSKLKRDATDQSYSTIPPTNDTGDIIGELFGSSSNIVSLLANPTKAHTAKGFKFCNIGGCLLPPRSSEHMSLAAHQPLGGSSFFKWWSDSKDYFRLTKGRTSKTKLHISSFGSRELDRCLLRATRKI